MAKLADLDWRPIVPGNEPTGRFVLLRAKDFGRGLDYIYATGRFEQFQFGPHKYSAWTGPAGFGFNDDFQDYVEL